MITHAGERIIDHRNSPGAFGVPGGTIAIMATKKCCGCQRRVVMNRERERHRHYCRKCDSFMCDDCALTFKLTGEHTPFNKIFQEAYESAVRGRQIVGVHRVRA